MARWEYQFGVYVEADTAEAAWQKLLPADKILTEIDPDYVIEGPWPATPSTGVNSGTSPDLATCDNCSATSESGWGDTPLCLDCQRKEDASKVCEEHQRTFEDATCPVCEDS